MKYQAGKRRSAKEYERALVDFWKKNRVFEKSIEQRNVDRSYVFYDGPPFITGNPHHGTLLSSVVKDAVPRFWTMRGYRVERRWGWDCHGLPAENFTEKHLGGTVSRTDDPLMLELKVGDEVSGISLERYIETARELMVANSATWEATIDRIGRFVDFKGAYKTMDKDFMESVWWAFKTLYEKGKIYEGEKVLMYDTKFATPVSKAEVTMDNDAYQTVTDPSVYVKFKVKGEQNRYFLAWTTTPWTLPGNTALAINPKLKYVEVKVGNEHLILAKVLLKKVLTDDNGRELEYEIEGEFAGKALVGKEYEALLMPRLEENACKIWAADYVDAEAGTGIVHIAPAYGEEDFALAQREKIPVVHVLDDHGIYDSDVAAKLYDLMPWRRNDEKLEVWSSNKDIAKGLKKAGIVWKIEYIQHEYPFNPRSKQRIMYRAIPSWFFDIQGSKPLMLEKNEKINWFPEYLKHGRFAKNIEQAPDWNLSRDRFWATAMPVWRSESGKLKVVGSYDELYELSGVRLEDYHRPWVDKIEFDYEGDHYKRIDKVLDCWFESGSMPFAQLHYPFENKEKFEKNYPADFIVEYIGQVRAWFYYVHAVNTALFGDEAYKNVITTGTLAGNDGRKMSKSLGNYTDPNELMDKFSADALRFLMLSSPVLSGEDFALLDKDVSDVARKLRMIWNVYDFFCMYAEVDGWEFDGNLALSVDSLANPLDRWIVARLSQLRNGITLGMEAYNLPEALVGVLSFVDDLSNWFVRRSRRRFWKSEDDGDKAEAYKTLHYVLSKLALLLAPFTPFLAEELWQNMVGEGSVHLQDWPEEMVVDDTILSEMDACRYVITEGLARRMDTQNEHGQIKVRQPLAELKYGGLKLDEFYERIVAEEVNIKKVCYEADLGTKVWVNKEISDELREEGFVRELVRYVQAARKKAGLNVDDRIKLSISVSVPNELEKMLKTEVLAVELSRDSNYKYDEMVTIEDKNVMISLEKA